jgi:hypothetical protein
VTAVHQVGTHHPLHDADRTWSEVNCYVDLWVELLHARGLDPLLACGFALEGDLDGRQWTFHKYSLEDLRRVYGIRVAELNVWQPLVVHVAEALLDGRVLTVEVDAFHLPDTFGVSYGRQHVKTTIAVDAFDADVPQLGYFHGPGRYEVAGPDAAALLRAGHTPAQVLPPYVETIAFDGAPGSAEVVRELARTHLARRAPGNPVDRLRERVTADLPWLAAATAADEQAFHDYAFGTVRQCGAGAQLAADYIRALDALGSGTAPVAAGAAEAFDRVAVAAKSLQFLLYRRALGRR